MRKMREMVGGIVRHASPAKAKTLEANLQGFSLVFPDAWSPFPENFAPGRPGTKVFASKVFRSDERISAGESLDAIIGRSDVQ